MQSAGSAATSPARSCTLGDTCRTILTYIAASIGNEMQLWMAACVNSAVYWGDEASPIERQQQAGILQQLPQLLLLLPTLCLPWSLELLVVLHSDPLDSTSFARSCNTALVFSRMLSAQLQVTSPSLSQTPSMAAAPPSAAAPAGCAVTNSKLFPAVWLDEMLTCLVQHVTAVLDHLEAPQGHTAAAGAAAAAAAAADTTTEPAVPPSEDIGLAKAAARHLQNSHTC